MYLIGIGDEKKKILKVYQKLVWEGIDVQLIDNEKELVNKLINDKNVKGAIRGTLSSSKLLPLLRNEIGQFYRASIMKNPFTNNIFLLAPVGIDEISENNDKIKIINYLINYLKSKNITPKIGLLSNGRLSDYGRSNNIDKSLKESEEIINYFKEKYNGVLSKSKNGIVLNLDNGIKFYNEGILIEEYLKNNCNIIIASDGITGNLIFRCLGLVCNIKGYGALILNKNNINFIDTSRSGDEGRYYNAVKYLVKNGDLS